VGSVTQLIVQLINRLRAGRGGGGGYGGGQRSYGGSGRGGYGRGGRSPKPQLSPEQMAEKAAQSYAFKEGLKEDYGDIVGSGDDFSLPGIPDMSRQIMGLPSQIMSNPAGVLQGLMAPPKR
jgi:hypothetical protein